MSSGEDERLRALNLSLNWKLSDTIEAHRLLVNAADRLVKSGKRADAAACLREAAAQKMLLGEASAALGHLITAAKIDKKLGNIDGLVETSAFLAYVHSVLGNSNESLKEIEFASSKLEQIKDMAVRARVSLFIGQAYYAFEDLPNIYKFDNLAVELFRNANDTLGESKATLELAYAHLSKEDIRSALEQAERSRQLSVSISYRRGEGLSNVALGLSYFKLGQVQKALNTLVYAQSLFPPDFDKSERAVMLYNLGRVFQYLGDCKSSLAYFESSVHLLSDEGNLAWLVGNLWTLGEEYSRCGERGQALVYLENSMRLSLQTNKPHSVIQSYTKLGTLYSDENELEKAEFYFRLAAGKTENTQYEWSRALAHLGLGTVYERKRDFSRAENFFSVALDSGRLIGDKFIQADALESLANVYLNRKEFEAASTALRDSVALTDDLVANLANTHLVVAYRAKVHERYANYVALLMNPNVSSFEKHAQHAALIAKEKARSFSILENLRLADNGISADSDEKLAEEENSLRLVLNKRADELTNLIGRGAKKSETEALDREINDLQVQLEGIKAVLKEKNPIYSAIKDPPPFDLVDFQANVLGEDEVLLEYFLGNEESYLWFVGKNDFEAFVLPAKSEIETKVDGLRELLDARKPREGESFREQQARVAEADLKYAPLARELSNMILGPVAEKLNGKQLIVVPDGKLHYFPISALPLPNASSDDPLLLTNEVVYQPSAQTYSLLKKIRQNRTVENSKDLLVFSDPVFNFTDPRLTGVEITENKEKTSSFSFRLVESFDKLSRLPASGAEARTITDIVGGTSDTFTGFSATRGRLLNMNLADYSVLHFATHARVDQQRPELSGFVLSRYDEAGRQIDETIRMQDIYAMKLNADLVVLSACQTGTGKEIKGEGVMGLNTAFLQAGARSVVASLWPVEDNATNRLMKEFYRGMSSGQSPVSALRNAQIALYKDPQFRSPFFWAAFTVQGDANIRPAIAHSTQWWILGIGVIPVLLVVVYVIRHRRTAHSIVKV